MTDSKNLTNNENIDIIKIYGLLAQLVRAADS